jgi:ATP-binding cassette, subfamily B, bacterial
MDRGPESEQQSTISSLIDSRWHIAKLARDAGWPALLPAIVLNLLLGLLPVGFLLATSLLLGWVPAAARGGPGAPGWDQILAMLLLAGVSLTAQQVLAPLQTAQGELITRRVDGLVFHRLMAASVHTSDLPPIEDHRVRDHVAEAARELEHGFMSPGRACAGLVCLLARYVQLAGCVIAVGVAFSWWAAAAVLGTTMLFRYNQRGGLRKYSQLFPLLAGARREVDYFRDLATGLVAGKEIRVFGLAAWLTRRYRKAYVSWVLPIWAERRRIYLKHGFWITAVGLFLVTALVGALGAEAADSLSLTRFALVIQAVLAAVRLGDYYPEADVPTQYGMNSYDALRAVEAAVAEHQDRRAASVTRCRLPAPGGTIRFERVSFHYPRQQGMVFDGLDLTLPAGRSTALVGLNGAGKTTLVKLLARLYEPTAGTIRVDDVDLRGVPDAWWRRHLAVVFQDYLRYEASAADNIGFGAVEHLDDRAGILAAARAAGIADALDELPLGLDTPLARQLTDGTDLSGGQWQRIAIARVLFALRHGASVLVLDEPTASLDVRAEMRFYEEFVGLTEGVTTLLISHRFATVRRADTIVVLERGRVLEQGSHEELLHRGGRYADLYRLQASRFRDDLDLDGGVDGDPVAARSESPA